MKVEEAREIVRQIARERVSEEKIKKSRRLENIRTHEEDELSRLYRIIKNAASEGNLMTYLHPCYVDYNDVVEILKEDGFNAYITMGGFIGVTWS